MRLILLLTLLFTISCASNVKTSHLKEKNLIGYWSSSDGSRFNYMEIKCNGQFQLITYDQEDKGSKISEITSSTFTTSPQMMGHYYEVFQWPTQENGFTIKLKYVSDSFLQKYSSSYSRLQSDKEKVTYTFRKSKKYKCR